MGIMNRISSVFKKKTIREKIEERKKKEDEEKKSLLNPYLYPKKISHMINTMKLTHDKDFHELGIKDIDSMVEYLETVNEQRFTVIKNFISDKGGRPGLMTVGTYTDFPSYQTIDDDLVSQFGGGKYTIKCGLPKPGSGLGYYTFESDPISKEEADRIKNPKRYSDDPEERVQSSMKIPRAPKGSSFEEVFFYNWLASNPDAMKEYGAKILEEKGLGNTKNNTLNDKIDSLTEQAIDADPELLSEIVTAKIKKKFHLKDNEDETFIEQYRNLKEIEEELTGGKGSSPILDAIKDIIPVLPAIISEGGKFMGGPQPQPAPQPQSEQLQIEPPESDLEDELVESEEEKPREEMVVNIAGQGNVSVDPVAMTTNIEVENKELAEMYIAQNRDNLKLIVAALSSSIESGADPIEMIKMIEVMSPQAIPHLQSTSSDELLEYVKLLENDPEFVDHIAIITSVDGEAWIIDFISKVKEI